jgi:small subunit ribosomal protein S8
MDPISDMLTRIRNAQKAHKPRVSMPYSKLKDAVAQVLLAEGFIDAAAKSEETPAQLVLTLKYIGKRPAITEIARESKPGHRMYRKAHELPKVLNGFGIAIISTSSGLMTGAQAVKKGMGGEVICSVY